MLQICPKLPDQQFKELPFKEEILTFLRDLGHSGEIKPNELTNEAIKDFESYKEYYAIALGAEPPKTKASVKKKQVESDKTNTPPTAKGKRLKTLAKGAKHAKKKQLAKTSKPKGLTMLFDVALIEAEQMDDEEDDDEDSDEEIQGVDVEEEEMDEVNTNEEEEVDELYRDVNVNLKGRDTEIRDAPPTIIQTTQVIEDTHVIITPVNPEDVPVTTIAEPPLLSATTLSPPPIPLITHPQKTPIPTPTTVPSFSLQDLPNFAVSSILGIVDAYLANKMHEVVKTAAQLQSDRLRDEDQAENADFINKLDDNIKKIIKDQVKEQVKAQVSNILRKIEKTVNEQLEAEVLTRSSNESKTSHVVAANLSELELKKILIDKMESNKSIHRSDEQKNLYKALVDAYCNNWQFFKI
ncbi:hypothetical protein Tco_1400860 [Tanacetum coccineum]